MKSAAESRGGNLKETISMQSGRMELNMHILALESSTTSAKAMLYNAADGTCEVRSQAYRLRHGDVSIHDAEDVFRETIQLGREMSAGKEIGAVALSGTWHSVMLCDHAMKPQTPVYHWSYTGAAALCQKLRRDQRYVRSYYQKTGCMVNAIYPYFKLRLLAEQGYDLKNYRILGQGTYNTYRLTDEWVVSDCIASGTGLLNIRDKTYDMELLEDLGIQPSQLGGLVTYKDTAPLSEGGATLLGLPAGIPVVPTISDGALNQVGSGALRESVMTFSVGTSGAIRLTTKRPVIPEIPSTWCYLAPGTWLSGAATSGCCNCIDWFKSQICENAVSYEELDRGAAGAVKEIPVFLPFLFGERCPGWDDKRSAGFFSIKPAHTKADLYRALLEGVLFNLYQCYEVLRKTNGTPSKIKLSGGILNSPIWLQMCADIFGVEMEADKVAHASLLGAVALARENLGLIPDLSRVSSSGGRLITPNPDMTAAYEEKYARYLDCYHRTTED